MLDIDENWNPEPYISQNITKNILKISFHLGHIKESIEKVFQPGGRGVGWKVPKTPLRVTLRSIV